MADKTLRYILEFDSSSGTASLKKFTDGVGETESRFGSLKSAIAALGIAVMAKQVVDFGVSSVKAFNESEAASAKLEAVIASTGGSAGLTKKEMDDLAASLSMMSGIDDEVITGAETIIATFKNIKGDTFKEATAAALDMSTVMGTDASSAAAMLGKALNNPAEGLSALTRAGVSFTASEKTQITTLVETGKTLDAQSLILKKVEESFGGAAKAAGQTFGGQVNRLMVALGDLQEEIGGALAGSEDMKGEMSNLIGVVRNLVQGVSDNAEALGTLASAFVQATANCVVFYQKLFGLQSESEKTKESIANLAEEIANTKYLIQFATPDGKRTLQAQLDELQTMWEKHVDERVSQNHKANEAIQKDTITALASDEAMTLETYSKKKAALWEYAQECIAKNHDLVGEMKDYTSRVAVLDQQLAASLKKSKEGQTDAQRKLNSQLSEDIKKLSLDEFDYKRYLAEKEYQDELKRSGDSVLAAQKRFLQLAQIDSDETKARQEELNKQAEAEAKFYSTVQDYINQTAAMEADALAASLQSEGDALMERIKNHAATAEEIIAYETRMTEAINAQGQARLDAETENLSKALLAVGDNVDAITRLVEASNSRRAVIEGETTGKIIAMQSDIKSAVEEANKKQNEFWDSFAFNAQTAQELNQTAWTSIRDSIKDAIANANLSIQGMVDIFKSAIIEMAATAAANTITITIAASMGLTAVGGTAAEASTGAATQGATAGATAGASAAGASSIFDSITMSSAWMPYATAAAGSYLGSYAGGYVTEQMGGNNEAQTAGSMAAGAATGAYIGSLGGPLGTAGGALLGGAIGYLSGPGFGGGVDNSPQEIYGINSILGNTASGLGDIGSLFASWKAEGNSEAAAFVLQSFDDINDRIIQTTDILPSLDSQWQALSNQFYDTGTIVAEYGVNSQQATDATISLVGSVIDLADAAAKAGGAESTYLQAAINTATSLAGALTPATEAETQAMKGLATSAADYAIQAALAGNASSATTQQMVSLATALNQDTVETNNAISSFNSLITSLAAVDSRMAGLTNTSNALTLANNILGSATLFDVETLQQASAAAEKLTGIQTRQQEIVDALANAHNMDAESVAALQAEYAGLNDQASAIESSLSAMGGTMSDSASAGDAMSTAIDDASLSASDSVSKMQEAAGGFSDAGSAASTAAGYVYDLGDAINSLQSKTVTVSVDTSSPSPDGSHAGGLDYVPFDGYLATLHKGERVQTAQEAAIYRSTKTSSAVSSSLISQTVNLGGVNITINTQPGQSTKEIGDAVINRIKESSRRGQVILYPRGIGRSMT